MKDGKCPKCNKTSVYTKRQGIQFAGGGFYISDTSWSAGKPVKEIDHFVCTNCGYFETYIADKGRLEGLAKDKAWTKVG